MNIFETAKSKPEFSTLVTAVNAAGLTEALSGKGPLTIFAPTNAAFAKLPAGALDNLQKPENKEELIALLKLHVVSGKHMAAEFANKSTDVATLGGEKIAIKGSNGGVSVGAGKVGSADVNASNGVIHVIDTVLSPVKKAA